jgi:hypothetical protein
MMPVASRRSRFFTLTMLTAAEATAPTKASEKSNNAIDMFNS